MKRTSGEILGSHVGIEPVRLKETNCRTDFLYHSIIFDQSITIHPPIHHSIGMCIKFMYIIIYIYIIHLYIHLYIYGGCPKYLFPDSPQSLSQSRSNRGTTVSNRGRVCFFVDQIIYIKYKLCII